MKRIAICLMALCLMLAATAGIAQEATDRSLEAVQTANHIAAERALLQNLDAQDDETKFIVSAAVERMYLYEMAFIQESSGAESEAPALKEPIVLPEPKTEELTRFQTEWQFIAALDAWLRCDAYVAENYTRLFAECMDDNGDLIGVQRLDIARREDAMLLLFLDYNAEYYATNRYAVCSDSEGLEGLSTATFGVTMNVALDPEAWMQGNDWQEWDKSLLYASEVQ